MIITLSNQNQEILMQIINDINHEGMVVDLLTKVLNLDIREINQCELEKFDNMSEYGFALVKVQISLCNNKKMEIYLNYSNKDCIKQNIFCFWCMIYEKESKKEERQSEWKEEKPYITIKKVQIQEIAREKYKDSMLLKIANNTSEILKNGAEIHLLDFEPYIQSNKDEYNELQEWEKYIKKGSEDILLVGMLPEDEIKEKVQN